MAVETVPAFEQESTYGAVVLRRAFGTLLQRGASIASIAGGLVGSTDMQVTAGTGMQVLVGTGEAWVPGSSTTTQSGYYCRVESSTALSIAASSESNPRIDTVIGKILDKAYGQAEDSFSVAVVTGTAESGATLSNKKGAGAVPASSLVLAYVLVPAKAVSIESADIENVAARVGIGNGPWTAVTLGAKLEANASFQTIRARTESGGASVRLRGVPTVKSTEELKTGETLLTLPVGFRPPGTVFTAATSPAIEISAAGIITANAAVLEHVGVVLDGVTFNLS
jgi:hypothetical protein